MNGVDPRQQEPAGLEGAIEMRIRVEGLDEHGDVFAGALRIAGNVAALARSAEMAGDSFFFNQVLVHVFSSFNVVRAGVPPKVPNRNFFGGGLLFSLNPQLLYHIQLMLSRGK